MNENRKWLIMWIIVFLGAFLLLETLLIFVNIIVPATAEVFTLWQIVVIMFSLGISFTLLIWLVISNRI